MPHTRHPRRRPVTQLVATMAALTLVATACSDDDGMDQDGVMDQGVSLETAVRSTLDRGDAEYTIRLGYGTPDDLAVGGLMGVAGDDELDGIDGHVQFDRMLRSVILEVDGHEREVIVDGQTLYVELDADDALVDYGSGVRWGRIDLAGSQTGTHTDTDADTGTAARSGSATGAFSSNMLLALHDPGSMLAATIAAHTGTAEDDAGAMAPDTERRRETVNVSADDIDDPLTKAMVQLFGELPVYVWFDHDNGDDVRVERFAYALPNATGAPTDAGTEITMSWFVVVEFDDFGDADAIELPEQEESRDIDVTVLTEAVTITVLPGVLGAERTGDTGGIGSSGGDTGTGTGFQSD